MYIHIHISFFFEIQTAHLRWIWITISGRWMPWCSSRPQEKSYYCQSARLMVLCTAFVQWTVPQPRKMTVTLSGTWNILAPQMTLEVDGSDEFPSFNWVIFSFQPLILFGELKLWTFVFEGGHLEGSWQASFCLGETTPSPSRHWIMIMGLTSIGFVRGFPRLGCK